MKIPDFPKLECPFVRKDYKVDYKQWLKYGSSLGLREPSVRLVTDEVAPGYEWVMDHPDTFCCEKLDGTNVGVYMEKGRLLHLQNRANIIDPLQIMKGKTFIIEGIFTAISKGFMEPDGLQYGEVLGPKLQGNPYNLSHHIWYPFKKAQEHLRFKSFSKYPRSFLGWSVWFEVGLKSLYATKLYRNEPEKIPFAEGIIFYNHTLGKEGRPLMAKLRRNMFPWFYQDKVTIFDLENYWIKNKDDV